jgi:hypothetical protein
MVDLDHPALAIGFDLTGATAGKTDTTSSSPMGYVHCPIGFVRRLSWRTGFPLILNG